MLYFFQTITWQEMQLKFITFSKRIEPQPQGALQELPKRKTKHTYSNNEREPNLKDHLAFRIYKSYSKVFNVLSTTSVKGKEGKSAMSMRLFYQESCSS